MATKARRRTTAAIAATVLAGAMAVWAAPAQAAATGVIAGHVTTSAGAPAADITVYVNDADSYEFMGQATTAADGSYSVGGLATNSYVVGFFGADIADQYFDGKSRIGDADPVQVTTGQTTTVNEDLLPTGYIEGKILDATGAPIEFLWVQASDQNGLSYTGAPTDSDGNYRLALPEGSYLLSFDPVPDSFQQQYIPGQLSSDTATLYPVTAGAVTRADDRALPTGTISGRLTNSDGTPAVEASVFFSVFKASGTGVGATTDSNGEFTTSPLLVGPYMVEFWLGDRGQYYKSAANYDDADPVTVTAGRDTHIDESLLPTGDVRVRAYDAVSGAGIRDFCAGPGICSNGTGQVLVPGLYAGPQRIDVYTESNYVDRAGDVNVRPGETVDVTVRMLPAAHITTTVVDKATGKALSGVCLTAYQPGKVGYREGFSDLDCSDATGKVTLHRLTPGQYRLFADPMNNAYGRQWVGANGGTGDERAAVTVNAVRGKTVAGPAIRIDRSGSIRGRVTDAATGTAMSGVGVGIFTQNPGLGNGEAQTDDDGRYQIDGLGPYNWPVAFMRRGAWADAWTGGAVSRYASTGTPVTAGGVATADIALTHGVTVRGTVVTDQGTPVSSGRINILNTETGDYTGTVDFDGENYELHLLPGQEIMFRYEIQVNGKSYDSDKAALPPATPGGAPRYAVTVPAGGLTLDLVVNTN